MRRIKQNWSERCQIMKGFVVHIRDLSFALCEIQLEVLFFFQIEECWDILTEFLWFLY